MEVPTPILPSRNSKYLEKHNPRPFYKIDIKMDKKVIGYLQLVEYFRKGSIPHLEYSLDKEYWGRGIMGRELPKYLKRISKDDYNKLVALVDTDNIASEKLLDKNGFVYVATIGDKKSYIVDLRYTRQDIEFVTNVMAWHAENRRRSNERFNCEAE